METQDERLAGIIASAMTRHHGVSTTVRVEGGYAYVRVGNEPRSTRYRIPPEVYDRLAVWEEHRSVRDGAVILLHTL